MTTSIPKRAFHGLIAAVILAQAGGCAFGTRYADLQYPPETEVTPEPADLGESLAPGRTEVVLLSVEDGRIERGRIGNVRNTVGMDTASIITEDNVASWVSDAIEVELNALGYRTRRVEDEPYPPADRLAVAVTKVYCDVYAVYDGEVVLEATLDRQGAAAIKERFATQVNSGLAVTMSGESAGESLSQALQLTVRKMLHRLGYLTAEIS